MGEARIWHGGDLDEARQLFPQAPEPWIDLSTGINPIAYPMPALPAFSFERLPSPTDHRDLEEAAVEAYAVKSVATVAINSTESDAPPIPKSIAAHITNGRTAKASNPSRTENTGRSPKTSTHVAVRSVNRIVR